MLELELIQLRELQQGGSLSMAYANNGTSQQEQANKLLTKYNTINNICNTGKSQQQQANEILEFYLFPNIKSITPFTISPICFNSF